MTRRRRRRRCWFARRETLMNALPAEARKIICIPCESFENKLLFESRLSPESVEYALLKKVLFQHLTFDDRYAVGKLYAIVAGSYPAFLGKTVKRYGDVDVFIIANDANLIQDLLHTLLCPICTSQGIRGRAVLHDAYEYHENGDIITVKIFGKIQLIVKRHYACLCDFHLNARFFKDFHHCTRWRLYVFKNLFLVGYMHLERGRDRGIICRKTAITLKRAHDWGTSGLYPNKHIDNVLNFEPPTLSRQALHVILRNKNLTQI